MSVESASEASSGVSPDFHWFSTGDDIFSAMLESVNRSARSIHLETYAFSVSPIGERFRDALIAAAARGLAVKVMVDAWGSITTPDAFWSSMRAAGGEFRWYNPLRFRWCGIRNHRKLLVCDGETAYVGGFNITPEFEGDGVNRGWRDLGLRLRGPLARTLADSFEHLFSRADMGRRPFAKLRRSPWRQTIATDHGDVLLSGPGRGRNHLMGALRSDIRSSSYVGIICPYFLPPRTLRRSLTATARRGARVELILPGKSDIPVTRLAARWFYGAYLRSGIHVYEYQPQILHAKLWVFDDVVYMGSANLDRRSCYINHELMLRLQNPWLVRRARDTMQTDVARSLRIDPVQWKSGRSFWTRALEYLAFLALARVDPYLVRGQLRGFK